VGTLLLQLLLLTRDCTDGRRLRGVVVAPESGARLLLLRLRLLR